MGLRSLLEGPPTPDDLVGVDYDPRVVADAEKTADAIARLEEAQRDELKISRTLNPYRQGPDPDIRVTAATRP
jgi:hypothetical protein